MTRRGQAETLNLLLLSMKRDDFALLEPDFARVALPERMSLHKAGETTPEVYFPEDGVASIVAASAKGKMYEVGIFGREGMSGTPMVLGTDRSPHDIFMQIGGMSGLRISTAALKRAMAESGSLTALLLCYVQTMMIQVSASAAASAGKTLHTRLARWLLMCHDRIDGDEITLTHEFMGMMLGSRRAGVTEALHVLEGLQIIKAKRGLVIMRDRPALERIADDAYGQPESEYQRLIGARLRRSELQATRYTEPDELPARAARSASTRSGVEDQASKQA